MKLAVLFAFVTAIVARPQEETLTPVTYTPAECAIAAQAMPDCGKLCIRNASEAAEVPCVRGDLACLCANNEAYTEAATACVAESCSEEDQPLVQPASDAVCACANPPAEEAEATT